MVGWRNFRRFFYKMMSQPGYAFGVFRRRIQAYLSYSLGDGKSSNPEAITLYLTHRCNLHCQMCGQWGEGGINRRQSPEYIQTELSLDELKAIIDDISLFKPNITLFGGEPLLYSGCIEIIKYIKQKGMHCLMITNGSLLEGRPECIVDSGLDELNVSLDGNALLHNQIRGMPGLFEKIMRGLKHINYLKSQRHKKKPLINLQCTINQKNYRYLEQLIDVANEAGANSLTFHNLIFVKAEIIDKQKDYDELLNCTSFDWQGFIFDPQIEPQILHQKIKKILSDRYCFSVDFYPNFSYPGLLEYYQNPEYLPSEYPCRCLSPWLVAYIFPDGKLRPCLNFSYTYGNIKNEKFSKLWNNEQAVRYRRLLKKNRVFPVCVRCTELYRY